MILMKSVVAGTFGALILALTASLPAAADETGPGNLANACAGCHGTDGISPGPTPSINAMLEQDMIALLTAFKNDKATVTIMNRIAKGYTDAEIAAIAAYFAAMAM